MAPSRERLTVSLDPSLVAAAHAAVRDGRASSVSAWVSKALAAEIARDRQRQALRDAVAAYEAEHGAFTDAELADLRAHDEQQVIRVRASPQSRRRTKKAS